MSIGDDARRAVETGVGFLAREQLESGEFRVLATTDPEMVRGCAPDPSIFPTAIIAQVLSGVPATGGIRARALDFLLSEMDSDGLWRHWTRAHPHHDQLPPDLDDSSCASSALAMAGRPFPDNRALLLANRTRRGLFFTWVAPRPLWRGFAHARLTLRRLRHLPALVLFFRRTSAAPFDVDAVVNANCLFYLGDFPGRAAVEEYLLAILARGDEESCDKWYDNVFVIRYFLSRALAGRVPDAGRIIADRISRATPSSALESALAASSLLRWAIAPDQAAIRALLDGQLESGAWPRAALYHGGRERGRGGGFAAQHPDTPRWGSEELTTAFALEALSQWLEASGA